MKSRGNSGSGVATAFLARRAIASSIAVPGAAVLTALGPGTVQAVREDGVAVVVAGMAASARASAGAWSASVSAGGDRVRWEHGDVD